MQQLKTLTFILLFTVCASIMAADVDELLARKWTLIIINNEGLQIDQFVGEKPGLQLEANNKFSAFTGCNKITGSYKLSGTSIEFADITQPAQSCAQWGKLEAEYLTALRNTKSWDITDNFLNLQNSFDNNIASFAGVDAY